MNSRWVFLLTAALVVLLTLGMQQGQGDTLLVLFMPFDRTEEEIKFSGGPHAYLNTDGQAVVGGEIASGLDFANTDRSCDDQACGFEVLSMAPGWVAYAGLGPLGNMVAVKLCCGDVYEYLIYGHLASIDQRITDRYVQGLFWVDAGSPLGIAGGTGASGRQEWPVHLHVELRDGRRCTISCINATDIAGNRINGLGGNPASWIGVRIGDFTVFPYCRDAGCELIYNYDGILVRQSLGIEFAPTYVGFSYSDIDINGGDPILRRNVYAPGLPSVLECNGVDDCEDVGLLPPELRDEILFSGKGVVGEGPVVASTNLASLALPEIEPQFQVPDIALASATGALNVNSNRLLGGWQLVDERSVLTYIFCPNGVLVLEGEINGHNFQEFSQGVGEYSLLNESELQITLPEVEGNRIHHDGRRSQAYYFDRSFITTIEFAGDGTIAFYDESGEGILVPVDMDADTRCPGPEAIGSVSEDANQLIGGWQKVDEHDQLLTMVFCPGGMMFMDAVELSSPDESELVLRLVWEYVLSGETRIDLALIGLKWIYRPIGVLEEETFSSALFAISTTFSFGESGSLILQGGQGVLSVGGFPAPLPANTTDIDVWPPAEVAIDTYCTE